MLPYIYMKCMKVRQCFLILLEYVKKINMATRHFLLGQTWQVVYFPILQDNLTDFKLFYYFRCILRGGIKNEHWKWHNCFISLNIFPNSSLKWLIMHIKNSFDSQVWLCCDYIFEDLSYHVSILYEFCL